MLYIWTGLPKAITKPVKVRRVAPGTLGIPMPAMLDGDVNRKLQGGMPPEGFRSRNDWSGASPKARSDGTSYAARAECYWSHKGAGW